MWFRIGVVVPFRVLTIEVDRELIVFKNSLLVESFSGPRPQDIINKIVKIAKLIKPKILNIFMMKKKIYNMFSKIRKI